MADLTLEQFEQLPDFLKDDYIEQNGAYRHAGLVKVKQTADELNNKLKARDTELNDYKSAEQSRIDAAKKEAYDQALKDGNSEEIAKRHAEQIADAEQRALERGKNEALKEFKQRQAENKADKIALRLAADIAVDEYARDMIHTAIKGQITVDAETDQEVYLSAAGSATTLTYETFKSEVIKNPRYARLIKDTPATTGGGNAQGSGSGGASGKKFNELSGAELSAIRKENPAEYERLRKEFYN